MFWPWDKKKQAQQDAERAAQAAQAKPVDKRLECPYCGHRFEVKDLVFAMQLKEADTDEKRMEYYQNHYLITEVPKHQRLFCTQWSMSDAVTTEKIKIGNEIIEVPLIINGTFTPMQGSATVETDDSIDAHHVAERSETGYSSHRLCPHCHSILDEDCCTHKKVIIGLYGGKRSGKTTFMTMVTYFMDNRFDSLGLGKVRIAEESRTELDKLLEGALNEDGLDPTEVIFKRTCFPIVAIVKPAHSAHEPFILVFQDIPGELAKTGDTHQLLQHNEFIRINAFIGIADIHMFTTNTPKRKKMQQFKARQRRLESSLKKAQDTASDEQQIPEWQNELNEVNASLAILENQICTMTYKNVFGDLTFATVMQQVNSVQIVMTKIDEMMQDAEGQKMLGPLSEINRDRTNQHENKISQEHLQFAHAHAQRLLSDDCKNRTGTMLDWVANEFPNKRSQKAYCAIASREDVEEGFGGQADIAWKGCINILDPVLNICMWERLLPVQSTTPDGASNRKR